MSDITLEQAAKEIIRHTTITEPEMVHAATELLLKFMQDNQINMAVGVTALYRAANIGVRYIIMEANDNQEIKQVPFKPQIIRP